MINNKKILVTGGSGMVGRFLQQIIPAAKYLSSKDCNLISENSVYNLIRDKLSNLTEE